MSYAVEWTWGVVAFTIVLVLAFVPWFAAIAVVLATIAVLAGLLALAAAALASPYLLGRNMRRRRARRRTRPIPSPSAVRSRSAAGAPAGVGRPRLTALASDEPDEAGAILEDVTRRAA
jgi:hypothetical protein